jgi:hypothetical protein
MYSVASVCGRRRPSGNLCRITKRKAPDDHHHNILSKTSFGTARRIRQNRPTDNTDEAGFAYQVTANGGRQARRVGDAPIRIDFVSAKRLTDSTRLPFFRLHLLGDHFCFAFFRFRAAAAAADAFFARATRWSLVIVSSDRRPPMRPPFAPCSRKYAKTLAGSFFVIITS